MIRQRYPVQPDFDEELGALSHVTDAKHLADTLAQLRHSASERNRRFGAGLMHDALLLSSPETVNRKDAWNALMEGIVLLDSDPSEGELRVLRRSLISAGFSVARPESEDAAPDNAAERTFTVLTEWLRKHPDYVFITEIANRMNNTPFQLQITTSTRTYTFRGAGVQDAYAQAAQAIMIEEL